MNKEKKLSTIMNTLNRHYPNPRVPLFHTNTFTLLVAVVLSAQSTDKKVNEITPPLFNKASTAKDMYLLGTENILDFIKNLGLANRKAKYIYKLSEIVIKKHSGNVPDNYFELEALPGVGHKTASVVMAQAFGYPSFPVDTHIHRLAQRWGLTDGRDVIQTEKDLKSLFPKDCWNKLHLQIIFYGREFCTARGCDGRVCSLCRELYPNRKAPFVTKKA